jgi:hypothetical protein
MTDNEKEIIIKECMEKATSILCPKLPIPAEPAVGDHWIH